MPRRARCVARAGTPRSSDQSERSALGAEEPEVRSSDLEGKDTEAQTQPRSKQRQADSTDWFASTLTRRFGLVGGLSWLGFLTFGVVSEQVKTRLEIASDERGTQTVADGEEVVLASGVRYIDLVRGGGQRGTAGMLMLLNLRLMANGELVQDSKKPLVFISGRRPYTGGLTAGAVEALSTMNAGGKRRIYVPASQGFGAEGGVLRPTEHVPDKNGVIPPDAELEYEIELLRVSVPP